MEITLRMAWRNIWRHRRRTMLNLAAVAFGSGLLVFNISLQLGSYDAMVDNATGMFFARLQIQEKNYLDEPRLENTVSGIETLADTIRANGDNQVTVRSNGFALLSSQKRSYGVFVVGVDPRHEGEITSLPGLVNKGRFFTTRDDPGLIVGEKLAKNLKVNVGSELTLLGTGLDGSMAATVIRVIGLLRSGSNDLDRHFTLMSFGRFQTVFNMQGHGHALLLNPQSPHTSQMLKESLQALLKEHKDLAVLDWHQLLPGMKELIELDFASSWFFYISLIAIITFSILNTFLMSVLERTREFGVMLALGFQPRYITLLILLEALLLAVIGVALGITLGSLVNGYFLIYGFSIPGLEEFARQFNMPDRVYPKISPLTLSLGPAIVLCATVVAAIYPGWRIRKLQPVEAMRSL